MKFYLLKYANNNKKKFANTISKKNYTFLYNALLNLKEELH